MLRSMTGFCNSSFNVKDNTKIFLSIKSLNSRFLEFNCRLPHQFQFLETEIIRVLKSKILRGTIYVNMNLVDGEGIFSSDVVPGVDLVKHYVEAIEKIRSNVSIAGSLVVSDLFRIDGAFQSFDNPVTEDIKELIMHNITSAADLLNLHREAEGADLEKDIRGRISKINNEIDKIKILSQKSQADKRFRLQETLNSVFGATNTGSQLACDVQNISIYNMVEKLDISEEIVRFNIHIKNVYKILDSQEIEKGKKLDFTAQELFREINTVMSKAGDSDISSIAIEVKFELEKIREQIQNIL